ncbi:linoleoyl-CoA desaturase [Cyclobacterium xiamenense]|uniref:Linoleoyl-CoA desaturase n=1 Tax=Cyclobacterium xiamenense TaxID=1297121 RepID=A0A1H6WE92_9BACT|nr:acyl-CoA desaturase [Cyclobacterium xiamenense]SEJ10832.1 linoleoyl-CoA desaturase [Cyclobacterium xiamenense]
MATPKFSKPTLNFHLDVKQRVSDYFRDSNITRSGSKPLYLKAGIMVVSFILVYVHLVFFTPHWAIALMECLLLGALTAFIGFNVMHDGAHGSFSDRPWVNRLAGLSINFLGANVFMWKTKHNVVHHSFTNVEGVDDDLNARPFLRLSPSQKKFKIHQFQHYYFIFTYSLLYLYWVFFTDYKKYVTKKVGMVPIQKMKLSDHISFWGFKAIHLVLFVAIPVFMLGWTQWLIGFFVYSLFAGVLLTLVFQLAHSLEETAFPLPSPETNSMEDEWMIHQIRTTANFATGYKLLTWFLGGLNYQVEHHLFPKISHVHYPAISKILRQVCAEYNIPYLEHPKLRWAFRSHVRHLKVLGRA